jgi:hypothetical protein
LAICRILELLRPIQMGRLLAPFKWDFFVMLAPRPQQPVETVTTRA